MGVAANRTDWSGSRGKCVKGIDLLVPEEGIEPTLPVKGTGF
jgi:hypothetical protein